MSTSKHPFPPFIPKGATKLIIGTIPPQRFCDEPLKDLEPDDVNFYYGSKDNYFWRLLSKVTGVPFTNENTDTAINERKEFLTSRGYAITDIIDSCERKNDSALDEDLSDILTKDLKKLLVDNPQIDTLIYTSMCVKSLVYNHLGSKSYHTEDKNKSKYFTFKIEGIENRLYNAILLYSPSRTALRGVSEEDRFKQYEEVFK